MSTRFGFGHVVRRKKWIALVWLAAALVGYYVIGRRPANDCETAARTENNALALLVCRDEFAHSNDPHVGALLASLYLHDNTAVASALATTLLATPARADALQVLGRVEFIQGKLDDAAEILERARVFHLGDRDMRGLAIDDQQLAGVHAARNRYDKALRALGACIDESQAARDRAIEGFCHMSAAQVLDDVGELRTAEDEINRAEELLTAPADLAWLALEQGQLEEDTPDDAPPHPGFYNAAIDSFKRAVVLAGPAGSTQVSFAAHLNLVYAYTESDQIPDAETHLAFADAIARGFTDTISHRDEHTADHLRLAGRIAAHRGDRVLATSLNERALRASEDLDDQLWICVVQARLALANHDFEQAEQWAQRGIDRVDLVRAQQTAPELRPWVLASRRTPFALRFVALARMGRAQDALLQLDQWQGRTLQDQLMRGDTATPEPLSAAADDNRDLSRLAPLLPHLPAVAPSDPTTTLATLQSIDLLALVVADDRIWRVTSQHGALAIRDLGKLTELKSQFDNFMTTPTDPKFADRLGALLLAPELARATPEALYVIIDRPFDWLQIPALHVNGVPLIELRPVIRATRISETGCTPAITPHRAVVIGDSTFDRPKIDREVSRIAARFGVPAWVGNLATSSRLLEAKHATMFYFGGHADIDSLGGYLKLADRNVSGLEISAQQIGPELVVLAACVSGISDDGVEHALPSAFLAAGSHQVIATLREVHDGDASALSEALFTSFDKTGIYDPVRALAEVQRALAYTNNQDWPNFAVFGHDVCRTQ